MKSGLPEYFFNNVCDKFLKEYRDPREKMNEELKTVIMRILENTEKEK